MSSYNSLIPGWAKVAIGAVVGLVFLGIFMAMFHVSVASNEVCVHTRFKKVIGTYGQGWNWTDPFSDAHCYSRLKVTYEASMVDPNESDSKADYVDYAILARTKEGIDVRQPFVVQYHIDPTYVETFYRTQYRSMERIQQQVVNTHVRAVVPQIMSQYDADFLYSGNLKVVSDAMLTELKARTDHQGVIIDYFELKRGRFDEKYEAAIQSKNQVKEDTKKTELQQQQAAAEAERQRIEAEGNAQAARIAAQGDADAAVTRAEGQAQAEKVVLETRAEQISAHPELITWHQIDTIETANVIYLPSDVLPIMPLTDPNANKQ